ncbi:hypothetical protein BJV77DRAFT_366590 [Russula vinacea]|nr:hypothetical protein BJV77DRAFT_366590 [Russula vinacea]
MSPSTPANQDPALAPPPPATAPSTGPPAADPAASPHLLDSTQVVQLLRHFPSVYQGTLKESAAEALSALGALGQPQTSSAPAGGPLGYLFPFQSNSLQSTHSKRSLFFLSLSLARPHTPMGHQISATSRRLLQLQEVLHLYPIARQDHRM